MGNPLKLTMVETTNLHFQTANAFFNRSDNSAVEVVDLSDGGVICKVTFDVTADISGTPFNHAKVVNWQNQLTYYIKVNNEYKNVPYTVSTRSYKEGGKLLVQIDVAFPVKPTHCRYGYRTDFLEFSSAGIAYEGTLFLKYLF